MRVNPGFVNKVELKGEISYPGAYEIRKGDKLFDLINRAGGLTRNTYLPRAYIFRGGGDSTNIKANKLEVNLSGVNKNDTSSAYNIELMAVAFTSLMTCFSSSVLYIFTPLEKASFCNPPAYLISAFSPSSFFSW